jgi:5-(carboxyamino)imidazole ribonucleotide synthase
MTSSAVAMVNLLGDRWINGEPHFDQLQDDLSAHMYLYGKKEPRPGRKMGHLTMTGDDAPVVASRARSLRDTITR